MAVIDQVFDIIAEEVGIDADELTGDTEFADLGVDKFLSKAILSRIHKELKIDLPNTTFDDYPTADDLQARLDSFSKSSSNGVNKPNGTNGTQKANGANGLSTKPPSTSSGPLSFTLQNKPETCAKTLFLLPDGSGSGMAYARLPKIDPSVCLVALNSPYLKAPTDTRFTIEGVAELWAAEIQTKQPHGPYYLGGWSAGGYYSFEVAKHLIRKGEKVEKLVLIDSPCRLVYEALPMEVVRYLSTNNLMGNWGGKTPPDWMVNHFDISIAAIEEYMPTPMQRGEAPGVNIIWAAEGVLGSIDKASTGLDFNVKVTEMLVERPSHDGAMGWDALFPGANVDVAKMPGNHFTIVYPPNVSAFYKETQE